MNQELVLSVLHELADADYQAELWEGKITGEQSSFTEAVCVLFDDYGLSASLDSGVLDATYSPELCATARQLRQLIRQIDDTGTTQMILSNPRMIAVRHSARELARLFLAESDNSASNSPPLSH